MGTPSGNPNDPDDAPADPPQPVFSEEFWGGFSSGYEGPDRRRADRGPPADGERRERRSR